MNIFKKIADAIREIIAALDESMPKLPVTPKDPK